MENRRKIGDVNASLQDTLSGIRVVQSFVKRGHRTANLRKAMKRSLFPKVIIITVWEAS